MSQLIKKSLLLTACLFSPIAAFAFDFQTDLSLTPDTNRYSHWCYIQFTDSHRGYPSNPPPRQWSSAIIAIPSGTKGMQLSWFSPDSTGKNDNGRGPKAYIENSIQPEINKTSVFLKTIVYWDLPWKLFVGFDTGESQSTLITDIKPCDAKQFTPELPE